MTYSALADLIGQFIHRVDRFLFSDFAEIQAMETGATIGEIKAAHERRMDARDAMRDAGRELAPELVAAGYDANPVLHLLNCIDRGGGAARTIEPIWPQAKVSLQGLALQLQSGKGKPEENQVAAGPQRKRRGRGRPRDADAAKIDARIYDARQSGDYTSVADLTKPFGKNLREIKLALDRERKRRKRAGQ